LALLESRPPLSSTEVEAAIDDSWSRNAEPNVNENVLKRAVEASLNH
jgi:hypothetical protein